MTQRKQRLIVYGIEPTWQQTLNIYWYHTLKTVTVMQVSHYKLMYQLQEKTERSAPPFCVSGGKNLKHILVYSCAGGWISYTAGSMLFVVKSYKAKKCNNGADHSLCLVSFVFLCNGKTIYRVQIFVRIVSKKRD